MNAVIRLFNLRILTQERTLKAVLTKEWWMVFFLTLGIILSAMSIVYVKDLQRRLYIQWETAQQMHDRLQLEWRQLLLEQSTWATQARIQQLATIHLDMAEPDPSQAILVSQ